MAREWHLPYRIKLSIMQITTKLLALICAISFAQISAAQPAPARVENIPYLVTFGKSADKSWGDDDYCQTFFFVVPKSYTKQVFIRVFDPDCGGKIDEGRGPFDTKTKFTVFGGNGAITVKDAISTNPTGNYRSGTMLATKTFGVNEKYDGKWYTFGPFNPTEGEDAPRYGGYVFKLICQGVVGNDGNLYKYFLSMFPNENKAIEGGNAFTFEYSFRMHDDPMQISHIYPYADDRTIAIKQSNFDWDNDGFIRIISVAKKGEMIKSSKDNTWAHSDHDLKQEEKNSTLDIQFIKSRSSPAKNNNVVFYVTNQYGEYLPFYTVPIGGVPKYKYSIGVRTN